MVMVVEDEPLLLEAIGKKLENEHIDHKLFQNSNEALEYLKTAHKLPDAIWLDYYLKEMDGLTFMTKIRENNRLMNIPVIVVSNSASDDKVKNMLALGVKKYLLKAEYRLDDIVTVIRDFIKNNYEKNSDS